MDWRAKVELFEEIRREYEFGIGTIAGVAKKLKVHRRMVREAIGSALPKPRKTTEHPRWKIASAAAFVDRILESAPIHRGTTAHRIWERIRAEMPECRFCERTVRHFIAHFCRPLTRRFSKRRSVRIFCGVFRRLRYDDLNRTVKIVHGFRGEERS